MREMGIKLLYKIMNVRMSSTNCLARPVSDEVWKRYHCSFEKNHVRILLPTVEPIDRTRRRMKRNTICTLTCRSTAVRLIGAPLGQTSGDNRVEQK